MREKHREKNISRKGMIKVPGLIHKMVNKINPSLALFMIQKIYCMYHDINNKEARNYAMVLTSMVDDIQANKKMTELKTSCIRLKTINLCYKVLTSPMTSMRFNQDPRRFKTVIKLGLVIM